VLHINCTDRPGLLSRIAAAIVERNAQVHNARIATFGERVEDTFLISTGQGKPLSREDREALSKTLKKNIEEG
jgi:[protein-PII] uridylyltransferase